MLNILKEKKFQTIVAYSLMILSLLLILIFKVAPAILAGLLAYVMTKTLMEKMRFKGPPNKTKEKIIGLIVGVGSIALLTIIFFFLIKTLKGENFGDLITTLIETINKTRTFLPPSIAKYIPENAGEIKETIMGTIKTHISSFANFGKDALHEILLVIIGWLIGILVACKSENKAETEFSKTWNNIWLELSSSFKFVVFAQVKVATFNSFIISLFLFVACPIAGWDIPYSKTLILITFFCGLLPIIGNLISNTVSFMLAMTVSMPAAIAALCVLILIHKLEYFIISKSLGADIDSDIWELLIVLFTFEILFGVAGMVFSPILFAFFKKEMRRIKWLPE